VYQNGKLAKVQYADHVNNDRFAVQVRRQHTPQGWFETQTPVGKVNVPVYHEFQPGNQLVWASKGGINNGLSSMYYIQTADSVNSSSVANRNTPYMSGQGGYRYHYYDNGLLQSVESYNAHDNGLFHTTTYQYNDLQLLKSERKVVSGDSVFNEVANASVEYHYLSVDRNGNWLRRMLQYQSGNRQASLVEARSIEYFNHGKAGAVTEKGVTRTPN
jgi:phage antirepressor YoqD-like protein